MLKSTTRAISRLSNNKLPTTFFLQTRHAEVLNSPASVFFGGQKWGIHTHTHTQMKENLNNQYIRTHQANCS